MPPKTKAQKAHTKSLNKAREALQRKNKQESIAESREGMTGNDETSVSTAGAIKKTRGRRKAVVESDSNVSVASNLALPTPLRVNVQVANGQTNTGSVNLSATQHIQVMPQFLRNPATFVPTSDDAFDRGALIMVLRACQAELGYWRRQHPDSVAKVMQLELENKRLRAELDVEKHKCANMMNGFRGLNLMVKNAAKDYSQLVGLQR